MTKYFKQASLIELSVIKAELTEWMTKAQVTMNLSRSDYYADKIDEINEVIRSQIESLLMD